MPGNHRNYGPVRKDPGSGFERKSEQLSPALLYAANLADISRETLLEQFLAGPHLVSERTCRIGIPDIVGMVV